MDKKIKGGIIIAAATLAGLYIYRQYQKMKKELENEKEANERELESIGVSVQKLKEEVDSVEDDGNMVKALAVGTMFNADWDEDLVNTDLAVKSEAKISITQEVFGKGNSKSTDLVFYFDIPDYTEGGYKSPRIGDYIKTIGDAAKHAQQNIIIYCPRPRARLIGVVGVVYNDPDDPEYVLSDRAEITDPNIYAELADEYHDGLTAFYEGFVNKTLPDSVSDKLQEWVDKKWKGRDELEIEEVKLVYRVSFPFQDQNGVGINYKTALETLKYFTDELEVTKKFGGGESVKYENVLFYAPDKGLSWYYYVNENNKIDIGNSYY